MDELEKNIYKLTNREHNKKDAYPNGNQIELQKRLWVTGYWIARD